MSIKIFGAAPASQAQLDALDVDKLIATLGAPAHDPGIVDIPHIGYFPAANRGEWILAKSTGTYDGQAVVVEQKWRCTADGTTVSFPAVWSLFDEAAAAAVYTPQHDVAFTTASGTFLIHGAVPSDLDREHRLIAEADATYTILGVSEATAFVVTVDGATTTKTAMGANATPGTVLFSALAGHSYVAWFTETPSLMFFIMDVTSGAAAAPSPPAAQDLGSSPSSQSQAQLQALYDAQPGGEAPDTLPQEVVDDANALATSGYKVYLGHNVWWYTNRVSDGTTSNWTQFGSVKGTFSAAIARIYTFK